MARKRRKPFFFKIDPFLLCKGDQKSQRVEESSHIFRAHERHWDCAVRHPLRARVWTSIDLSKIWADSNFQRPDENMRIWSLDHAPSFQFGSGFRVSNSEQYILNLKILRSSPPSPRLSLQPWVSRCARDSRHLYGWAHGFGYCSGWPIRDKPPEICGAECAA